MQISFLNAEDVCTIIELPKSFPVDILLFLGTMDLLDFSLLFILVQVNGVLIYNLCVSLEFSCAILQGSEVTIDSSMAILSAVWAVLGTFV